MPYHLCCAPTLTPFALSSNQSPKTASVRSVRHHQHIRALTEFENSTHTHSMVFDDVNISRIPRTQVVPIVAPVPAFHLSFHLPIPGCAIYVSKMIAHKLHISCSFVTCKKSVELCVKYVLHIFSTYSAQFKSQICAKYVHTKM